MRTPHLASVVGAIGIALVILVGVALTSGGRPMITANEPVLPSLRHVVPPTTTTETMAPRPGSLVLDGVNPCTILTRSQRTDLSLDSTPAPYTDASFAQAKACTIRGLESGTVARLALVLTMGVDVWLSSEAQVQTEQVKAAGFPALVVRTPGLTDACAVDVDTGQNQFLDVLFRDGGNTPPIPQDTLCLGAQRVAEAAVTSLKQHH